MAVTSACDAARISSCDAISPTLARAPARTRRHRKAFLFVGSRGPDGSDAGPNLYRATRHEDRGGARFWGASLVLAPLALVSLQLDSARALDWDRRCRATHPSQNAAARVKVRRLEAAAVASAIAPHRGMQAIGSARRPRPSFTSAPRPAARGRDDVQTSKKTSSSR